MSDTYIVETDSATPVPVQDLGIFVSKQKPAFISQEQLKSSLILTELKAIGRIRISKGSPAREVRARPPTPKPLPVAFQAPAPKGVRKPPAPPQRPARVAPPRRAPSKLDAPMAAPEAPADGVKSRGGRTRKDAAPPEEQNG